MTSRTVKILAGRRVFKVGYPLVVLQVCQEKGGSVEVAAGIAILGPKQQFRSLNQRFGMKVGDAGAVVLTLDLAQRGVESLIQAEFIDPNPEPNGSLGPPRLALADHHALLNAWLNPECRRTLEQMLATFHDSFLLAYVRTLREMVS